MTSSELTVFDPSKELLAIVSADNRLRLWDATSGSLRQQYVEGKNFGRRYTCVDWHRPRPQGRKRSSSGQPKALPLGLIALGTEQGTVTIWDLQRGVVSKSLGEGMSLPKMTALAFGIAVAGDDAAAAAVSAAPTLFTASADTHVLEWSVADGQLVRKLRGLKHGATSLCLHPGGKWLAVAGASVRILNLATEKRVRTFESGHAKAVAAMCFSPCGRYLAAAAEGSRFVELYDCADADASAAIATYTLQDYPVYMQLRVTASAAAAGAAVAAGAVAGGNGDLVTALVGCDSGTLSVLQVRREAAGGVVHKPQECRVVSAGVKAGGAPLEVVRACFALSGDELLVAHGSPIAPKFATVGFLDPANGALLAEARVEGAAAAATANDAAKKMRVKGADTTPEAGHVTGPGEMGLRGTEVDLGAANAADADEDAGRAAATAGGDAGDDSAAAALADERSLPLGERLEALSRVLDQASAQRQRQRQPREAQETAAAAGRKLPTVESMATVLQQALQSSDDALLEQCLNLGDPMVVEATVDKLPSVLVLPFLQRVVSKFEKRPARAVVLSTWIRAVLTRHTGYLMSVPGLASQLARLSQMVSYRLASFPKFLDLAGRLDLVLAHVGPAAKAEEVSAEPENVYNESDDMGSEDGDEDGEEDDDEDDGGEEGEVAEADDGAGAAPGAAGAGGEEEAVDDADGADDDVEDDEGGDGTDSE
ncbi:unnamed protein product [Phaeothamnion confervicola]